MVRITEELVRKRAEHNECQISTLEEVSLHQQDIERLEYLDKWCRDLKILYLQSNLIPKIENVSRLKKLEYLNLALNNIEKVENLEGCESLKKLDLTVNFVGELTSIESLKDLYNFKELFLTGNPCADFEHYREYVIATLPHLKYLDGVEIDKSERIKAVQNLPFIRGSILEQQERYKVKRAKEKLEGEIKAKSKEPISETESACDSSNKENKPGFDGRWYTDINDSDKVKEDKPALDKKEEAEKTYEEKVDAFWKEKTKYTPESRLEVHNHLKEIKNKEEKKEDSDKKITRKLFADDGRPFNINEPKVDFSLTEDGDNFYLDVAVFKHMDTSLLDCDVQPTYVRVTLKGKILQLCLTEEVNGESSVAKRAQITGHLVVTMPKEKKIVRPAKIKSEKVKPKELITNKQMQSNNYLEVDASVRKCVDVTTIVSENEAKQKLPFQPFGSHFRKQEIQERANSDDFVDDPDVPPLL